MPGGFLGVGEGSTLMLGANGDTLSQAKAGFMHSMAAVQVQERAGPGAAVFDRASCKLPSIVQTEEARSTVYMWRLPSYSLARSRDSRPPGAASES